MQSNMTDILTGGRGCAQIVTDTYHLIKPAADEDDALWHIGSIDNGYEYAQLNQVSTL